MFDDGHLGIITRADELAPITGRFLTKDVAPLAWLAQLPARLSPSVMVPGRLE